MRYVYCFLGLAVFFTGCGGGGGNSPGPVANQPPRAQFSFSPDNQPAQVEVQFDASGSSDPDGTVADYQWDFGDGQTGAGALIAHLYENSGVYTVVLTITDDAGDTATANHDVTIASQSIYHTLSGTILIPPGITVDQDVNDIKSQYDPNDTLADAQEISNPAVVGGYVNVAEAGEIGRSFYAGDLVDYFKTSMLGNETITLQIADPSAGDLDLFLYNDSLDIIDSSQGNTGIETVSVTQPGIFYIEVLAYAGASNYVLNLGQNLNNAQTHQLRLSGDFVGGQAIVRFRETQQPGTLGQRILTGELHDGVQMVAGGRERGALVVLNSFQIFSKTLAGSKLSATAVKDRHDAHLSVTRKLKYETLQMIKALRKDPDVIDAEPNYRRHANSVLPGDQYYYLQWHYPLIGLPQAWEITTGSSEVVTAVIDTGVLLNHPDLSEQLVAGYDFIRDSQNAVDGDGIDSNPDDPGDQALNGNSSFHGTHVAGTIAAHSTYDENLADSGVTGVAGGSRVMPLRVLGKLGGTSYDLVQAVRYAAGLSNDSGELPTDPVDVINLSLGGGGYSQIEANAFALADDAGIIVIAAAGNEATATPSYPAAYDGVIAVSAVDIEKQLTYYSNSGDWIDIAGPGGQKNTDVNGDGYSDGILSTLGDDADGTIQFIYSFEQGTSMACPHVAGVAALMKSVNAQLTAEMFRFMLQNGDLTEDIGPAGRDDFFGYGLIDANRAVMAAQAQAGTSVQPDPILIVSPAALNFGQSLNALTISLRNGSGGDLSLISIENKENWISVTAIEVGSDHLGEYLVQVDRSSLDVGIYQCELVCKSSANEISLPVRLQVVDAGAILTAGYHYILLVDSSSGEVIDQVEAVAENGQYPFTFQNVLDGSYEIYAGTDNDNDLFIGDGGEAFGVFRTADLPEAIVVDDEDIGGIEFYTGYPATLSSYQALQNGWSGGLMLKDAK